MADYETAEKHLMSIFDGSLEYINKNLQEEKNIQLDVNFYMETEKKKIYASAGKRPEGGYIVKVSMAAYNIVEDYYSKMICIEGFYQSITLKEIFDEKIAENYLRILIDMTLRTIIFHELGHIFNGHIDYINFKIDEYKKSNPEEEITYIAEYLEKSEMARPYLLPIDWQALEWNADDFAITRLIGQYTYKDNIDGNIIKSISHAFFIITAAITSMYCLLDMNVAKDKSDLNDYQLVEHLPKRFCLQKYLEVAELATKKFNNVELFQNHTEKHLYTLVIKRFEEWYVLYIKVKSGKLSEGESLDEKEKILENNKEELDDIHKEYYSKVDDYYLKNLPRELKEFTYCKVYL